MIDSGAKLELLVIILIKDARDDTGVKLLIHQNVHKYMLSCLEPKWLQIYWTSRETSATVRASFGTQKLQSPGSGLFHLPKGRRSMPTPANDGGTGRPCKRCPEMFLSQAKAYSRDVSGGAVCLY